MLRMITSEDCANREALNAVIDGMRRTFATVFSEHYAELIKKAYEGNDVERLDGFADVINKHFNGDASTFTKEAIIKQLYALYYGAGFDDEAAFIKCFASVENSGVDAAHFGAQQRLHLSKQENDEVSEYVRMLSRDGRALKAVNFVAIVDARNKLHGFCIYHLFKQDDEPELVLHIRQAAMLERQTGYASAMARYLMDRYPKATYEANRRLGNPVELKIKMLKKGLLTETPAVLGYSDKFTGLLGTQKLSALLGGYYLETHNTLTAPKGRLSPEQTRKLELRKFGGEHFEAESVPRLAFSPATFFRDACRDDTYLGRQPVYLRAARGLERRKRITESPRK